MLYDNTSEVVTEEALFQEEVSKIHRLYKYQLLLLDLNAKKFLRNQKIHHYLEIFHTDESVLPLQKDSVSLSLRFTLKKLLIFTPYNYYDRFIAEIEKPKGRG